MNDDRKLDDMDMDNVAGGGKGKDELANEAKRKEKKQDQTKTVDLGNVIGGASKGDGFSGTGGKKGDDGKVDSKPEYKDETKG